MAMARLLTLALIGASFSPARAIRPGLVRPRAARSSVLTASLPAVTSVALASTVPTLLGYWKSEYGVSYAYGTAIAVCGGLYLPAARTPLAVAHAACLLAYGVRLNAFLLYRELWIPRFVEFREKIEQRAASKGSRLARTPFVLSCSFLYFCMATPLRLTFGLRPAHGALAMFQWGLVGLMYSGFGVAAIGDLTKTRVKAARGENTLVTQGIFKWLRHPNYTGELLLWTANAALAVLGALCDNGLPKAAKLGYAAASAIGAAGIAFVLLSATSNLEKKQKEKYGEQYTDWAAGSWSGPKL